nr:hypothetical protein HmN_000908300 [Hymenolepis microstoma]
MIFILYDRVKYIFILALLFLLLYDCLQNSCFCVLFIQIRRFERF